MLSFSIIDFSWSASVWITWQLELSKLMKIKILHKYQINSNYTQFTAIIPNLQQLLSVLEIRYIYKLLKKHWTTVDQTLTTSPAATKGPSSKWYIKVPPYVFLSWNKSIHNYKSTIGPNFSWKLRNWRQFIE